VAISLGHAISLPKRAIEPRGTINNRGHWIPACAGMTSKWRNLSTLRKHRYAFWHARTSGTFACMRISV
jgi:hypothetical protein